MGNAPGNDPCATAKALTFDAFGRATSSYDTRLAKSLSSFSCDPSSRPWQKMSGVVFKVTVPTGKKVQATATDSGSGFQTILAMRSLDCETGVEIACVDSWPLVASSSACCATPGDVFVFVRTWRPIMTDGNTGVLDLELQDP